MYRVEPQGSRPRRRALVLAGAALAMVAVGCGGAKTEASSAGTTPEADGPKISGAINLVAYSTPQEAYDKIEKAVTAAGNNVRFQKSYGASGDQSRAVDAGQPADYVGFALEPDMTRLVKSGKVADDWNKNETKGMVTNSATVFVVREGNPKNIKTWADLTKPGIEVLNANPFTSGGARWNVMAAYGANSNKGKDEAAGVAYLNALYKNVVVQDDSARKALQTFAGGKGDVLLSYENEAIFAQSKGESIDYVLPDSTILIENPAAVTKDAKNAVGAKALLAYVLTPEGQKIFVENGYRPVTKGVPGADKFPIPSGLFTIQDFGGWDTVTKKFFDPKGSIMADVERAIGVSVESK
jgi:sulfate/thiosulfate transport system substrate-binding protein